MKLGEILDEIRVLKPSQFTDDRMKEWLKELEEQVMDEVINCHEEQPDTEEWPEYAADADEDFEMLMPAKYGNAYIHWLESKIDYFNEEMSLYNNDMEAFNAVYTSYQAWYTRTHMPITRGTWRY